MNGLGKLRGHFLATLLWSASRIRLHFRAVLLLVPVALLALGLAGYGWWWRVVAERVRSSASEIQIQQRTLGRNIEWDALNVGGFPYQIEATLTKARLLAPDTGTALNSERIILRTHPLALNRISIALEGEQHFFHVAQGRWIEADARADQALIEAVQSGLFDRVTLDLVQLTGKGKLDASDFNFIVERASGSAQVTTDDGPDGNTKVELASTVRNVALQGNLPLPLGPAIELVDLDLGFQLPKDLEVAPNAAALADAWRKTGTPLEIRRFELAWGGISISASGEIRLDDHQQPDGKLKLTLGNHPRILELAEAYGWISKETHSNAKPVLDVLAFVSGDPKRRVTVPLSFREGNVYLGPVKLFAIKPKSAPVAVAPPTP